MRLSVFLSSLSLLFVTWVSAAQTENAGAPSTPLPAAAVGQLREGQPAPAFTIADVLGNNLSLEGLRGRSTLLAFMRDAGCPICELRLAQLGEKADSLKKAGTRVVLIYESDVATMRRYLVDKDYPFTFVADPDGELHARYGLENSLAKVALGFAKGVNKQIKAGKKLQTQDIPRKEANLTRITADFIIDENLLVRRAYYGRYLGDHLAL